MTAVTYRVGDVRDVMASLPDGAVDLVVTSPPFLALRSYLPADHPDKDREIGSEPTPAAFLDTLLALTAEWGRLITPTGSIAVELGDTYSGSGGAGGDYTDTGLRAGQEKFAGSALQHRRSAVRNRDCSDGWPLERSLALIPQAYALSLAYGRNIISGEPSPAGRWRVRNVVRWVRPNPPVGALGDKVRPATSEVIIATRDTDKARRWFDLDAERALPRPENARPGSPFSSRLSMGHPMSGPRCVDRSVATGAPLLDWWEITPGGYTGAHYAVFPVELPRRLVSLMCPFEVCRQCGEPRRRIVEKSPEYAAARAMVGDFKAGRSRDGGLNGTTQYVNGRHMDVADNVTVGWSDCGHGDYRPGITLDPFGGSGTTAVAAARMGRDSVLIDLDGRNVDLARQRLRDDMLVVSETTDGDTTTWTVDAQMPGVRSEHPDQQSLFAEVPA